MNPSVLRAGPLLGAIGLLVLSAGVAYGEGAIAAPERPASGRWHSRARFPPAPSYTPEQMAQVERLSAIGYLSGTMPPAGDSGVFNYQPDHVCPGVNLYTSGHAPVAILMDASGKTLHQWRVPFAAVWPAIPEERQTQDAGFFRRAYAQRNGDLLAIFEGYGLVKLDRHSNILWAYSGRAHHDLDYFPNGDLCVLTREIKILPKINPELPVLEDFITTINPVNGKMKQQVSIVAALINSDFADLWLRNEETAGDIFHTNSVFILPEDRASLYHALPEVRPGNVLLSIRHLDMTVVVDLETKKVVWARTGPFKRQHDAQILPNGHLLLFDNLGLPGRSAVYEFEPASMDVAWAYHGTGEQAFRSDTCGTAQRLDNGNTLITASDAGYALEVTPQQTVVWAFHSPHRAGEHNDLVATLFQVERLPADFPLDWVDAGTLD